jgi:hypothetical protein
MRLVQKIGQASDGARDGKKNGTGNGARKDQVFAAILWAGGFGFCEAHDK